MKLPVTAIIVTKNEERNIARCLAGLQDFDEIIVVDSNSTDQTKKIAQNHGARVTNFIWNGAYPKKRQWCLDHIQTHNSWVFFIDADEETTPEFCAALQKINWADACAGGYFVRGRYCINGRKLKHGLYNNKLCLLHKNRMEFPVVNDLDIPGMGEIEGHYQPLLKPHYKDKIIGAIKAPILHHAIEDMQGWERRHERYACWEVVMDKRAAWPLDPSPVRRFAKTIFKSVPFRPLVAFVHSYILKLGILDGRAGFVLAYSRLRYYRMINALRTSTAPESNAGSSSSIAGHYK